MLVQGKLLSFGDDLTEAFEIRRKVFIEEQGISKDMEFDEFDQEAIHVVVYEGGHQKKAVATGRITYHGGDTCSISRVAVLMEYRGNKYGDFAVRMLLNRALNVGIKNVYLYVPFSTVNFFKKIGFVTTEDDFSEEGKRLLKMNININNIVTPCCKDIKCKIL